MMNRGEIHAPIGSRRAFLQMCAASGAATAVSGFGAARARATDPSRFIEVHGTTNTRDVGGYAADNGTTVARRRVFRSANLSSVTGAGVAALTALNLSTVIDPRSTYSVSVNGPDIVPSDVPDVAAPVGDGDADAAAGDRLVERTAEGARGADADPAPSADTVAEFRSYVTSASNRRAFARVLTSIASGPTSVVLYHCNSGTFVSGWTSAVLLTTLGVARSDVNSDFLLSNQAYGATVAFSDYLDAAFDQAAQSYGSVANYVRDGLGLADDVVTTLKSSLLV